MNNIWVIFLALFVVGCSNTKVEKSIQIKPDGNHVGLMSKHEYKKDTNTEKQEFLCSNTDFPESSKQTYSGEFIEEDLREILNELSIHSNIPIIADETIEANISVVLTEKTLYQSLNIVLSPNGYSWKRYEHYILVGDSSRENPTFHKLSSTCIYRSIYYKPEQIGNLISPLYRPFLSIEGSKINITAPNNIQKRIQSDILNIDKKRKQILLELTIMEVNKEGKAFLGNSFKRSGTFGFSENEISISEFNPLVAMSPSPKLFESTLSWLDKSNNGEIKSSPRILTINEEVAKFSTKFTTYIQSSTSSSLETIDYGVEMEITPYITSNNEIILDITKANVSDYDGQKKVLHSLANKVRVRDNEILILGGLLHKKKEIIITKTPILGDIPVLGWFFKKKDEQIKESEVLLMIKPRIIH